MINIIIGLLVVIGLFAVYKIIDFDDSKLVNDLDDQLSGYDDLDYYDYKHGKNGYRATHK